MGQAPCLHINTHKAHHAIKDVYKSIIYHFISFEALSFAGEYTTL